MSSMPNYSDSISISVSNAIFYPEWEPMVGEAGISAYYFRTVYTNQPWQIAITDVGGVYVQTLSGYATNGVIEAYWNLVDTNNVTRTNANTNPEFNSVVTVNAIGGGGSTSKTAPPKKQPHNNYPSEGKWVIAYQDFF